MKSTLRTLQLVVITVFLGGAAFALSYGPPLEYTGAPGEDNCTHCHKTNALNSGAGQVRIEGLPEHYEPGRTYPVVVRVTHPTARRWGFEVTSIADDGSGAGVFFNNNDPAIQALGPSLRYGRPYALHSRLGTREGTTGSAAWSFSWRAPTEDVGPITFYAIGNAADGDSTDFHDFIYTDLVTVAGQKETVRIQLTAPEAGSVLPSGETVTIRWSVGDGADADPVRVRVELSTDGGMTYPTVLAQDLPPSSRSVAWQVPDALSSMRARIRAVVTDSLGVDHRDQSSADLTIGPVGLAGDSGSVALPPGALARAAAWGDITDDGRPDLLVARAGGGLMAFVRGADGSYTERAAALGLAAGGEARAVAVGDYDNDGLADVAAVGDGVLSVYHHETNGLFAIVGAPTAPSGLPDGSAAAWADADTDGRLDLVVGSGSSARVWLSGATGFRDGSAVLGLPNVPARAIAWGPVVALGGSTGVRLFERRGASLVAIQTLTQAEAGSVAAMRWADVTGDGELDLVLAGSQIKILSRPRGGTTYGDVSAEWGLRSVPAAKWLDVADYEGDGDLDLYVVGATGREAILRNTGTAFDDVSARFDLETGALAGVWADADGDGLADLLTLTPGSAALRLNPRPSAGIARIKVVTDADGNASADDGQKDRAAGGALLTVDLDGDGDAQTGPQRAFLVEGNGEATLVPAREGSLTVRVEFVGGERRRASVVPEGVSVIGDPLVPSISTVRTVTKAGVTKLVLEGSAMPTVGTRIAIGDVLLGGVKAPKRFLQSDGTTGRLVTTDSRVSALLVRGAAVRLVLAGGDLESAPYVMP